MFVRKTSIVVPMLFAAGLLAGCSGDDPGRAQSTSPTPQAPKPTATAVAAPTTPAAKETASTIRAKKATPERIEKAFKRYATCLEKKAGMDLPDKLGEDAPEVDNSPEAVSKRAECAKDLRALMGGVGRRAAKRE